MENTSNKQYELSNILFNFCLQEIKDINEIIKNPIDYGEHYLETISELTKHYIDTACNIAKMMEDKR